MAPNFSISKGNGKNTLLKLEVPNDKLGRILVAIGIAWDGPVDQFIRRVGNDGNNRRRNRKSSQRDKKRLGKDARGTPLGGGARDLNNKSALPAHTDLSNPAKMASRANSGTRESSHTRGPRTNVDNVGSGAADRQSVADGPAFVPRSGTASGVPPQASGGNARQPAEKQMPKSNRTSRRAGTCEQQDAARRFGTCENKTSGNAHVEPKAACVVRTSLPEGKPRVFTAHKESTPGSSSCHGVAAEGVAAILAAPEHLPGVSKEVLINSVSAHLRSTGSDAIETTTEYEDGRAIVKTTRRVTRPVYADTAKCPYGVRCMAVEKIKHRHDRNCGIFCSKGPTYLHMHVENVELDTTEDKLCAKAAHALAARKKHQQEGESTPGRK